MTSGSPSEPRSALRGWPLFGLGLFLFAFVVRYALAQRYAAEPVWDGHYYEYYAKRIALGYGYTDGPFEAGVPGHPACHYPVGFSGALGLIYWIFGPKLAVARLFDALVSALVPVLTWRLARFGFSEGRARFAGVLTALHPGLCLYAALVMSEPLSSALMLGSFVLTYELRSKGSRWALPLGASVLGLATLVRPQALLCAPILLDWFAIYTQFRRALWGRAEVPHRAGGAGTVRFVLDLLRSPQKILRAAWAPAKTLATQTIVIASFCLLPVLPWTARNCRVMDGCAAVSTNGGWNLAIGAFPRATGRFESLHGDDACKIVTGQVQQDRCWGKYGIEQIKQHPLHWVGLIPAKLSNTFDHESFQVEYLHEARPSDFPDDLRSGLRGALTTFHRLLLVFAAFSVVGFVRGRPRGSHGVQAALLAIVLGMVAWGFLQPSTTVWPLVLLVAIVPWIPLPGAPPPALGLLASSVFLGSVCLTHILFFGEDRYHISASPFFCLLVAGAFRHSSRGFHLFRREDSGTEVHAPKIG